jgi:hypothetical protein
MINSDVESLYDYIPVGTHVWIGTDSKLASFGVKQYYSVVPSAAPAEAPSAEEPIDIPDFDEGDRAILRSYGAEL